MIFIDTGAFLARHLPKDDHRDLALPAWEELTRLRWPLYTSNFVLDETLTLLGRCSTYHFAAERGRFIQESRELEILRPDEEDEARALAAFEKFADQKVSFTDCISFVLMRRYKIRRAFSFDRHFASAGFELWAGPVGWVSEARPGEE
ncbi:MAG TPA: PIN domain-containing protein [Thermoanaerobaculia bacterium]|nr:PIN domain-containing protein [Thermoanaerobaculia bacterium]